MGVPLDQISKIWGVTGMYGFMGHCGNFEFNTIVNRHGLWHGDEMWHGGIMASDSQLTGRRFRSQPFHCHVSTLGKLSTLMCCCHQAV